jgi:hypothetical protein
MAARHALARAETPVSDSSPGTPDAMMGKYLRPQLRKSESMVQVRNGNRALLRRPRASMPTIRLTTSEQDEQTLFEDPMAIAVRCVRTTLGVESVCVAVVSNRALMTAVASERGDSSSLDYPLWDLGLLPPGWLLLSLAQEV